MPEIELYNSIRLEIVSNHVLMHWFTLIVLLSLLVGVLIVERLDSILAVFLPLLSVVWSAAMARFDFFIHRQNAYLRSIEPEIHKSGLTVPIWESWKDSLTMTSIVIPAADIVIFLVIAMITVHLIFGPARDYFTRNKWRLHRAYAWTVISLLILFLASLAVIPAIAGWSKVS